MLEDEAKRLYERDGFDLKGAVTVRGNDNFRSPRAIVDVVNALDLEEGAFEARSPYVGELLTESARRFKREASWAPCSRRWISSSLTMKAAGDCSWAGRGRSWR